LSPGGGRKLPGPQGLEQFVPSGLTMAIEHKIGEQESALASWQAALETHSRLLYHGQSAQLDPDGWRRRQGHANILSTEWEYN
jgi:hypothetical protein